eukprot:m.88197 g.88197  ORF g.88197 m.88197 type:complete len:210 (-) comp8355_c1_seq4:98-727(-)
MLEIDVEGQNIGDEGVLQLSDTLSRSPHVQRLYLCNNSIGPEGLRRLLRCLPPALNYLSLQGNPVQDEGLIALSEYLSTDPAMETVGLAATGITAAGVALLLGGLGKNTHLRVLSFSGNAVGDAAPAIGKYLGGNPALGELRLRNCGIDSAGARLLLHALSTNTHLHTVILENDPDPDPVFSAVLNGIDADILAEIAATLTSRSAGAPA